MPFYNFRQTYRDLQRIRQILNTLIKHGFGYLVDRLNLQGYIPLGKRLFRIPKPDTVPKNAAEQFKCVLEELGPTFIKFGQILSLRRDILSDDYINELEKLQDDVPPFSSEQARQEIILQFDKPAEKLFKTFENKPFAAASIGQVHKAQLFDDREVVVKIQRPGIRETIETDLNILVYMAKLIEKYIPESRLYEPVGMVEEFSKSIRRELDFRIEGRSADRFRDNFRGSMTIYVPEVIWDLSRRQVLTIEFKTGKKITEVEGDIQYRHNLAKNFNNSYLMQIFEFSFFHADPHPGNIFVLDDGRICFHDFGIMGYMDEEMVDSLSNLFLAFMDKDVEQMMDVYLDVGILDGDVDMKALKRDIRDFLEKYHGIPLQEFSFADFMTGLITIGRRYRIRTPVEFLMFGKTFMTVESIVRKLDPDFNLVENIRPYAHVLLRRKLFEPSRFYRNVLKAGIEINNIIRNLPHDVHNVIKRLKDGRIEIEVKHDKLEDLELHVDKASNRLSFSLIISAIIVGSSLIMQTRIGPLMLGFPVIGILGYFIAGFLGLWLVWAILKSGRL